MSKAPAFQLYVRDIISSPTIRVMSGESVKSYLYLLCFAWLSEPRGTLPDNDLTLAGMSGVSPDAWMTIKSEVMQNFTLKDGRWTNEKLLHVSNESYRHRRDGKTGGNPNFKKGKPNPYQNDKPRHKPKDKPSP